MMVSGYLLVDWRDAFQLIELGISVLLQVVGFSGPSYMYVDILFTQVQLKSILIIL
jgi:hypothetical protein